MKRIIAVLFCISFCLTFQGTATVAIGQECTVDVVKESMLKSRLVAIPALIRIDTENIELLQRTKVTFESDADGGLFQSVIPLVKLVNRTQGMINQFAIIMPAILTGNFDAESETITVSVDGCADTDQFELEILKLTLPRSE